MASIERLTADQARKEFGKVIDKATYSDRAVVITKYGEDRAAVISIKNLEYYQALEDYVDYIEAEKRLADYEENGGISLEEIKKEFGID